MESIDMTQKNIDRIGALFPNVITEIKDENGNLRKGINFELLKQELSNDVVNGEECYDFTWVGKKASIIEGNTPIRKTIRPNIEESRDWENTGNLYIEGDNLDALKLLQESYLNSIKMIYIDPPYNTGKDFIYKDNYTIDKDEYDEQIGLYDENENRLFQNTETNGRFHSDWCSMLYPRLKLAQHLLRDDGVIFISIDDNEIRNLKIICDEIFGEMNFLACIVWQKRTSPDARQKISEGHEYLLMYSKIYNNRNDAINLLPITDEQRKMYKNSDNDPRGPWVSSDFTAQSGHATPQQFYTIIGPNGQKYTPPQGTCWKNIESVFKQKLSEGRFWFGKDGNSFPRRKTYLYESEGRTAWTWWTNKDVGHTQEASKELKQLFGISNVFDNPKPVRLIDRLLKLVSSTDSIVLDFFSGSATTAHAVMQLNADDGGNRKFIMVQLPEPCSEESDAFKAGYKNICEIGKERIRRAGDKINAEITNSNIQIKIGEEAKPLIDTGFRVLKVDSTNMKDVYYAANEYSQLMLAGLESNIKDDRTDLDLLYGVLLDWGLPLSLSHKIEEVDGVSVHTVDEGSLVACFADQVSESVVREIAKRQPLRVVFRDSSFANSPDKINVKEIFKLHASNTTVKVI